jgi:hypothetical protein
MVERARELSKEIDALDEEIRAEELAELLGELPPESEPTAATTPQVPAEETTVHATITQEMAAREVAALETKARQTLTKRQQRLDAKANGVPVEGFISGEGEQGGHGDSGPSAA